MEKKRIRINDSSVSGYSFATIGELREWLKDFEDDYILEITSYDDSSDVDIEVYHYREETDAEYAIRFNKEQKDKVERETRAKALRYQQFLALQEEFERNEQLNRGIEG